MRERICYFLVVLLLIFSGKISGQQVPVNDTFRQMNRDGLGQSSSTFEPLKFFVIRKQDMIKLPIRKEFLAGYDFEKMLRLETNTITPARPSMNYLLKTTPLSPAYYASRLGFICKKELQLDKISPVALRFRLGSLDYVNWMDGKNRAAPLR